MTKYVEPIKTIVLDSVQGRNNKIRIFPENAKIRFGSCNQRFYQIVKYRCDLFIVTNYMMTCFAKDLELEISLSMIIELSFYS